MWPSWPCGERGALGAMRRRPGAARTRAPPRPHARRRRSIRDGALGRVGSVVHSLALAALRTAARWARCWFVMPCAACACARAARAARATGTSTRPSSTTAAPKSLLTVRSPPPSPFLLPSSRAVATSLRQPGGRCLFLVGVHAHAPGACAVHVAELATTSNQQRYSSAAPRPRACSRARAGVCLGHI